MKLFMKENTIKTNETFLALKHEASAKFPLKPWLTL